MTADEAVKKMFFLQKWFGKRPDFSSDELYVFWYEGSNSKYYRNEVDGVEPIHYRISVVIETDLLEIEARLYDQTDNKLKILETEKNEYKFEFISKENLIPIVGYVQELDIKFNKYAKDYVVKSKLKTIEKDFKR